MFARTGREVLGVPERAAAADADADVGCGACGRVRRGRGRLAVLAPVPDLAAIVVLDEGDEALEEERAPTWNARELAVERAPASRRARDAGDPGTDGRGDRGRGLDHPPGARGGAGGLATPRGGRPARDAARARACSATRWRRRCGTVLADGARVGVRPQPPRARPALVCRACGAVAQCERCAAAVAETDGGFAVPSVRPRAAPRVPAVPRDPFRRASAPASRGCGTSSRRCCRGATVTEVTATSADGGTRRRRSSSGRSRSSTRRRTPRSGSDWSRSSTSTRSCSRPRYRAAEQALWLLVRAARLVGPRADGGRILVQTRVPDHEVLAAAAGADPVLVTTAERSRRVALGFPPFGGLAELSGAADAVDTACEILRAAPDATVSGPVATTASARALVQASSATVLADVLATTDLSSARARGRVRLEVDPLRV